MPTMTGTLHVIRSIRRSRKEGFAGLAEDVMLMQLKAKGVKVPEYPPFYYMHDGRKVKLCGTGNEYEFQYNFPGQPKAFTRDMDGWTVTVKGSLEYWGNQIGATWKNYKIIEVKPPTETKAP